MVLVGVKVTLQDKKCDAGEDVTSELTFVRQESPLFSNIMSIRRRFRDETASYKVQQEVEYESWRTSLWKTSHQSFHKVKLLMRAVRGEGAEGAATNGTTLITLLIIELND